MKTLAILFVFLITYSAQARTTGRCTADTEALKRYGHLHGHAGCLVIENGKMLVVENTEHGRTLTTPGGSKEDGESAQCTAARETLEESGAVVRVGNLIFNYEDNFYLFECELLNKTEVVANPTVPPGAAGEISRVLWVDPNQTTPERWRFPDDLPLVKAIFNRRMKQ